MSDPVFEHPSVTVGVPVGNAGESRPSRRGFERDVPVRVDAEGVFVDGKLVCPRAKIDSVALRIDQSLIVYLNMQGGPTLTFKLSDAVDTQRLLESVGFAPSRVRTVFNISRQLEVADFVATTRVALPLLASFAALVLVTGLAFYFFGAGALTLPMGAAALASMFWSLTVVAVGVDGVRVRWLWLEKYYAFSDIEKVTHDGADTITLTLRSGGSATLQMTAPEHIADAVKRIEDGIAALKATPKATEAPALRERVTEASRVAELRRLGAVGEGDYRFAGLDREQLWAIVEDPANDAVVRANAAAALSGRLDDGDRRRLRVAASVTASPKVRVAFEAAASTASDEALAEALAQVEEVAR